MSENPGRRTETHTGCLSQRAAARLLGVSVSYLRASSAPRLLLPGNGPQGRPLLRYDRSMLLAWAGLGGSGAQQDAPPSATVSAIQGGKSGNESAKAAEKC